jgi:hypothetical protein
MRSVPVRLKRLTPMSPVKSMPASVPFYQKLGFHVEERNDDWGWAMLCLDASTRADDGAR